MFIEQGYGIDGLAGRVSTDTGFILDKAVDQSNSVSKSTINI
jgi:hypothetical protein